MDIQLINPFIHAVKHVLLSMASTEARTGKPFLKGNSCVQGAVSSVVALSGASEGTIALTFSEECILGIVSQMFGEKIADMNEEVKDAVGEILNIVSGYGRQKLMQEAGKNMTGGIPTVIMGGNDMIGHLVPHPVVVVPFNTTNGEFALEVCFEEWAS
jgi:chemotaxis protein CheX